MLFCRLIFLSTEISFPLLNSLESLPVFLSIILTTSAKLNFLRRKNSEPQKSRVRKSSQDSGLSCRGRAPAVTRNLRAERTERTEVKRSVGNDLSKSSSISNLSQVRPRSTSLTRSQSQRLGPGSAGTAGGRVSSAGRTSSERLVRPRSSTLGTNNSKGRWQHLAGVHGTKTTSS